MPRDVRVRRVAITGLGVVSCVGTGNDNFFQGLFTEAATSPRYVTDFDSADYLEPKEARQTDRFAQFSVASASLALDNAGPLGLDPTRVGVIYATGVGGLETLQEQITVLAEKGPRRVSPRLVPMMMPNAGAAAISMRFGFRGPCETVVTACASGTHAIGNAMRLIQYGRCDAVVAGGAEAGITPVGDRPAVGIVSFSNMTALSTVGVSRPYDVRRDGFVIAEGGAALVLEDYEHALKRGAHIYGELLGAASTADAHHITAPAPGGVGAISCMELALEDAGLTPSDITHINGHGTSTPLNDLAESQAIIHVFGDDAPPVTSIKGVTGHSLAAAGAIEAACVALSLERGVIPPTRGCEEQDPEIKIDIVTGEGRRFTPGPVLSNSFGFGGHNGCVVIGPAAS